MSNVYFKKIVDYSDKKLINDTCYDMLKKIILDEKIEFNGSVPLKVHFGEKGNDTFITPDNFEGIREYLKENNIKSCYIDTNVLYKGSRTLTEDHIKTAFEHGFTNLDVVIADGDSDNMYNDIVINKKHYNSCKIGYKYKDYDNYIILSHFKGHGLAGFGGALKQLAMGFASRGGKLHQHSESIPVVSKDKCIACGICAENCPVNAIDIKDCAIINKELCIGCAKCSVMCPVNAIGNTWNGNNFYEKMTEYAYAASLNKKNIYITFAFNITNECDCNGSHMNFVASNIGIFVSTDPVAIDKAVLDKLHEEHKDMFNEGLKSLKYAEELGMGNLDYNLILE